MKLLEVATEKVQIKTDDGTIIHANYFTPARSQVRLAVIICGAVAVRQQFYFAFAKWLASKGCAVLTFDYRGIGESKPESGLKNYKANKIDWGTLDMNACVKWLSQVQSDSPLHLIGHSAGGQLIGIMPNYSLLQSACFIACSSGYIKNLKGKTKLQAQIVLPYYAPLAAALFGYVPAKKIGLGEDLPAGVMLQWAHWCLNPGYIENSFGKEIKSHFYDEIKLPILSLTPADDEIATEKNVEDFLRLLPNAKIQRRVLNPADYELSHIGHMNFFRKESQNLWPVVETWLFEESVSEEIKSKTNFR